MKGEHLRAFLWLHWRLRVNQIRKGGVANAIFLGVLAVGALLLSAAMFVVFLLIGLFAFDELDAEWLPPVLMYVWDGIVVAFLMMWLVGLITDLQRAEALSLDRFLHLPVSLSGVFLLNYLSSLLSFTLILFLPLMTGLILGLIVSQGAALLTLVPLLAAFLLMVTAVTYQFQGWLASLMVNKRRRRTIVVFVTAAFILVFQLPNLINVLRPWDDASKNFTQRFQERMKLDVDLRDGKITPEEHFAAQQKQQAEQTAHDRAVRDQIQTIARVTNLVLPPGWLPLGAAAAAEGNFHYALFAIAGMTLIGVASLRRAYRTTLRLYTGQFTAGKGAPVPAPAAAPREQAALDPAVRTTSKVNVALLEKKLPWISEHAAAIALSSFRALTRAPEVKMLLLSPIILGIVFGGIFLRSGAPDPQFLPLIATGAIGMVMLTFIQLVGNQFGFDRGGFRVFVLCPADRGDILLGKNLAIAPLALTLGVAGVVLVQIGYRMRLDHFLATLPQLVSVFLLFNLLANCLSIMAPMPIAAGTLKPTNTKAMLIVLHFALLLVLPIPLSLTLAPLAIEMLVDPHGAAGWPIHLILSLALCVGVAFFYRWLIGWQGVWLQARELRILEVVTTKAE